jgi:LuxR family transcriptional regulator, maltose regulon positive regulatory protein
MAPGTPFFPGKTFRPPLPVDHLPRPDLLKLLQQASARRLVLLCAPAGFGKSTLATEYCELLPSPWQTVWVGLDARDAQAGRLLRTLICAFRGLYPQLGETELELLRHHSPEQPLAVEALLGSVLDAMEAQHPVDRPVLLVLDDYHLVQGPQCDRLCAVLLDRLPSCFQLLITSRQRPEWHLARLRLSNQLLELDERHLRLDDAEARLFLQRAGLERPDPQWLSLLLQRNEGWIAGLRLLAVTAEQNSSGGAPAALPASSHLIGEYLLEEVLSTQPPAVRAFLSDVGWLERFTAELCDQVREAADSRTIIDHLLAHRVFLVPLDEEGRWYRFHHLFSDVMRQAGGEQDLRRRLGIHERACRWFAGQGLITEAVEHALAAERPELAADLVQALPLEQLLSEQPISTMLRWKAELPVVLQTSSARLIIAHAWTLALACQLEDAEAVLGRLVHFLPQPDSHRQRRLLGQALSLRAYLARAAGRLDDARQQAHQALACLDDKDLGSRFMAMLTLADAEFCSGRLEPARQWARTAMEVAQRSGNDYFEAQATLMRARLMQSRGQVRRAFETVRHSCQQLDQQAHGDRGLTIRARLRAYQGYLGLLLGLPEALELLQSGLEQSRRCRDVHVLLSYCTQAAQLARRLDTSGEAFSLLAEAERLMHQWDVPPVYYLGWVTALKSDLWLTSGRRELAEHWMPRLRQTYCGDRAAAPPPFFHALPVVIELVHARLLWQRGEKVACESCLRALLSRLQRSDDGLQQLITLVHLTRLLYLERRQGEAEQCLRQALVLAEPDGLVGVFEALLQQAPLGLAEALDRAPASALRDRLRGRLPVLPGAEGPTAPGLREPLSGRERDVLQLIARGYSNQQISEALFISLHTVKSHARRINHKLGVARRTQAVAQAKVMGLLG